MQVSVHEVVEEHHLEDQPTSEIRELHLERVHAVPHLRLEVHEAVDGLALHQCLDDHVPRDQLLQGHRERSPLVVRELLRELDEVLGLYAQVQLLVHSVSELPAGLTQAEDLQGRELVDDVGKDREKFHVGAHQRLHMRVDHLDRHRAARRYNLRRLAVLAAEGVHTDIVQERRTFHVSFQFSLENLRHATGAQRLRVQLQLLSPVGPKRCAEGLLYCVPGVADFHVIL